MTKAPAPQVEPHTPDATGQPGSLGKHQSNWGVSQWAAYLKDKDIPVLPATQELVFALREQASTAASEPSARELTDLVHNDPYLAVKLMRLAERSRSQRLGNETTTQLAAVLQAGVDELYELIAASPVVAQTHSGWRSSVSTVTLAASIARSWASLRTDTAPEQVSLAALLSEIGELLMWHFHPELPLAAIEEFTSGRAPRTAVAQQQTNGFTFRQLTLALTESWQLPALIGQLIRGLDTPRSNIARIAIDTARHIVYDYDNPAVPSDIASIRKILPGVSDENLVAALPLSDTHKATVLAALVSAAKR